MWIFSLSERYKVILLGILLVVLALLSAPLIPAKYLPRSCLFTRMHGELERWPIGEGRVVLRFKQPTQGAVAEWRASGISDEMIASNLISIPDYGCDPVTGEVIDTIPKILRWDTSSVPSEYRASSFREAWTYPTYDPKTKSTNTTLELKPLPAIRQTPRYKKYENVRQDPPIGYLRVSSRLASELLGLPIGGKSPEEATPLFWEEVFRSNRPVILTEGAKKAASLLSNGYIGISIGGICRSLKASKEVGYLSLGAELEPLLRTPRQIFIAFDNDRSHGLRILVAAAALSTGELLRNKGADVRVVTIEGKEKGVDDFFASRGKAALDALIAQSKSFAEWETGRAQQIGDLESLTNRICPPPKK
jgi:hypothetical protein